MKIGGKSDLCVKGGEFWANLGFDADAVESIADAKCENVATLLALEFETVALFTQIGFEPVLQAVARCGDCRAIIGFFLERDNDDERLVIGDGVGIR